MLLKRGVNLIQVNLVTLMFMPMSARHFSQAVNNNGSPVTDGALVLRCHLHTRKWRNKQYEHSKLATNVGACDFIDNSVDESGKSDDKTPCCLILEIYIDNNYQPM
jgi:hypothetical protein